jgi:hypothetical protein
MNMRRNILRGLIALLVIHLILLYFSMYKFFPRLSNAEFQCVCVLLAAILLIYPASWLAHLKGGKHASYAAMAWVVLIGMVSCFLCWTNVEVVAQFLPATIGFRLRSLLPGMLLILLSSAAIQTLALYLKQFHALKIASWLLVGLMVYFPLLCCVGYVLQLNNRGADMIVGYGLGGAFLCLPAVCICVGQWRWHKWIGLGLVLISMVLIAINVSFHGPELIPYAKVAGLCLCFAVAYAHTNILWQMPFTKQWLHMMRLITQGFVCTSLVLELVYWSMALLSMDDQSDIPGMIIALAIAIQLIALVITGILLFCVAMDRIRINRKPEENHINYAQLQVTCPHCQTQQLLTVSGQCCCECRLQFHFRLIEPRCPGCDYLLIGYNKDTCPECGMDITQPTAQTMPTV